MSDLENLGSPPSSRVPAFAKYDELNRFDDRLERLKAEFHQADEAYVRAVERCYTPEFNAHLERCSVSEDEQRALREQRERETGLDDALRFLPDLVYAQILQCADEILQLPSIGPRALALKARACLAERPAEHFSGFELARAIRVLNQLSALG